MTLQMGTKKGLALAQLGKMLVYPSGGYAQRMEKLSDSIISTHPKVAKQLEQFKCACRQKSVSEFEELYTRTFDLAAICSPYVTGYIYGDENFDRGTLMATLGEKYIELGFDSGGELPDHLAVLLQFCAWLDEEALDELISFCLLEPVGQMAEQLKDSDNPYYFLLQTILLVLKSDIAEGAHG